MPFHKHTCVEYEDIADVTTSATSHRGSRTNDATSRPRQFISKVLRDNATSRALERSVIRGLVCLRMRCSRPRFTTPFPLSSDSLKIRLSIPDRSTAEDNFFYLIRSVLLSNWTLCALIDEPRSSIPTYVFEAFNSVVRSQT